MSRRITLYEVVSHHEFGDEGWKSRNKQAEIKLRFANIIEKISGIHPNSDNKGGFKNMCSSIFKVLLGTNLE